VSAPDAMPTGKFYSSMGSIMSTAVSAVDAMSAGKFCSSMGSGMSTADLLCQQ
jgi:hypothetical protein